MVFSVLVFLFYGQMVVGNDHISVCKERFKELKNEVKNWKDNCVDKNGNDISTTVCNEKKRYNKEMMQIQIEMCFYKGNVLLEITHDSNKATKAYFKILFEMFSCFYLL